MISVIVPVYRVEKYIYRCIDSILSQTFTDFDLVLVDDGSPDKSGKICDEYAKKDKRIHVIHKKNGGLSDARNAGIDWVFNNSNSEWITFIDSDDWVHPRYFEGMLEAAKRFNVSIAVSGYVDAEGYISFERINVFDTCYLNTEDFYINNNTIATVAWGKIYKKEYFLRERYPFGKVNEDEFVTYKLLFKNEKIAYVRNPMYFYFQNSEGIMHLKWSLRNLDILEAMSYHFNYFRYSKYRKAFIHDVDKYIWALQTQFEYLQSCKSFENKNPTISHIRKELRKCLRVRLIHKPINKNRYLYSIAYPRLIHVYYFFRRIRKKIDRTINKR